MSEAQAAKVEWAGIDIEVRFTENWLCGSAHHIELRANEPLSVTATGYKSHFVPSNVELDMDLVLEFVIGWLDEAAETHSWQDHLERRRQGDLFDL